MTEKSINKPRSSLLIILECVVYIVVKNRSRKAIEPLIAAVILVAVAIALSVAVAFWLSGVVGGYTKYEQIEVSTAYADWNETLGTWVVVLQLKNTGSSDSTVEEIFVNGRPHDAYVAVPCTSDEWAYGYYNSKVSITASDLANVTDSPYTTSEKPTVKDNVDGYVNVTKNYAELKKVDFEHGVPLKSGEEMTVVVLVKGPELGGEFKHGASIEFKIHTSAGRDYPKSVKLP